MISKDKNSARQARFPISFLSKNSARQARFPISFLSRRGERTTEMKTKPGFAWAKPGWGVRCARQKIRKSQIPEISNSENLKKKKSQNPKIANSENLKIRKSQNPKSQIPKILHFRE